MGVSEDDIEKQTPRFLGYINAMRELGYFPDFKFWLNKFHLHGIIKLTEHNNLTKDENNEVNIDEKNKATE